MGNSNPPTEAEIVQDRARELLDHSSSNVQSELAHAEGWLHAASTPSRAPGWDVDTIAGALGALANAWGRLTLWARGNETYDQIRDDLEQSMNDLVAVRQRLIREGQTAGDVEGLRDVLENMQAIHRTVEGADATAG